ncbi:MAG: hypothetical protein HOQ24_09865 [Mycobacteriaceae bacterium]|nr:hypothetical protein [Mycobacteriaceae bacterium]
MSTAASRDEATVERTAHHGLPIAVTLARSELSRDSRELGAELLRLCRQARGRAALEVRAKMAASGLPDEVLRRMGMADGCGSRRQELHDEGAVRRRATTVAAFGMKVRTI